MSSVVSSVFMESRRYIQSVIWRADVAYLDKDDWKYETSTAGAGRGGRTHTFGIYSPAEKLKECAAYVLDSVELKGGKPVLKDELPAILRRRTKGQRGLNSSERYHVNSDHRLTFVPISATSRESCSRKGRQPVTPADGARAVPAGAGSSPALPGGSGEIRPAGTMTGLRGNSLHWNGGERVTPVPA